MAAVEAFLDASMDDRASPQTTASVACARTGLLKGPVWAGPVNHPCRDTNDGCEIESRFWLGELAPPELAPNREVGLEATPDAADPSVLQPCHEEMCFLAS